jgi:predicted  nucleic acid-binding Zn-ribbon protein
MPETYTLQWLAWGLSLLAGGGAVLALLKLRYAERFLPQWNELKELEAQLPARREAVQAATDEVERLRAEIGQLEAAVGHLRILKEWQNANPEAPARIQQMMSDLERCKSELAAVQQKLAQDEKRLADVAQESNRLALDNTNLAQKNDALRVKVAELETRKDKAEEAVRLLDSQQRKLEAKVAALQTTVETLESRVQGLQQTLRQLEGERTVAIRERDQARADCNAARTELEGIQKAMEQLKELAKGMRAVSDKVGTTGEGDYSDVCVPVITGKLPAATEKIDEREALDRTRDYIRGLGLVFPERVAYAFHTSLKASDASPLVVLAGISGTGKSELPRHYADGMGLHFLLMAVQPRWDSPQDLFGFYNYLERRYKTTELTQALLQFERFNQGTFEDAVEDAEIDDRSDRMLVVLLDEMNLARTEYYFSELLSKLETRRMVNRSVASDRSRAEIALDGRQSLRLFPDENVLFVGTMNEDESTQSLSDKVIDRASVLRFGRPKTTSPEAASKVHAKRTTALTLESWRSWKRPISELGKFTGEVDGWIEQLNNALDRIGRPFAYRVDRAIRSYIANYPQWIADYHKRAMADQIEQRILPKLRGVEPDQGDADAALQTISRLIGQLDDKPLQRAFHASYQNQPTFLFRGVVRDETE